MGVARYRYVPWRAAFDADLRVNPLGAEGARRRALTVRYIADQWATPPDLTRLTVPALELCAVPSVASEYPWLQSSDSGYRLAQQYVTETLRPFDHGLCQRFATTVPGGRVEEVPGSHYVFFTRPEETARVLQRFLR